MFNNISELELLNLTPLDNTTDVQNYKYDLYDIDHKIDLIKEHLNNILINPNWEDSKLYYLIQAYIEYTSEYLLSDIYNVFRDFDVYFLKNVTSNIDEITGIDTNRQYYERYYELYNSYVNYLDDYIKLIDDNEDIVNKFKKDLILYFGKEIYLNRGTPEGYNYIENVLNPITITNLEGNPEELEFSLTLKQWGEVDNLDSVGLTSKAPFVYKLELENLMYSPVKTYVINLLKGIYHPAGYKLFIEDSATFNVPLYISSIMFNSTERMKRADGIVNETSTKPYNIYGGGNIYGNYGDIEQEYFYIFSGSNNYGYGIDYRLYGQEVTNEVYFGNPVIDYNFEIPVS